MSGNAHVEITVSSTLSDGNLSAFLWHTEQVPECSEDLVGELDRASRGYATYAPFTGEVMRAVTDLRHRDMSGQGSALPIGTPSPIRIDSHPFATRVLAGERLVFTVGGGSAQLQPDVLKPLLTVLTGPGILGRVSIPVVQGTVRFVLE